MSGRVVRARSCKKRSYLIDEDSSPEKKAPLKKKAVFDTPRQKRQRKSTRSNAKDVDDDGRRRTRKVVALAEIDSNQPKKDVIVVSESPQESPKVKRLTCGPGLEETFVQRDTWPFKYNPCNFGTFVGNTAAVEKLKIWLTDWKDPSKRNALRDNHESNSSSVSQQEWQSNAIFIKGPPGVGKTALVYYLANLLGYKVLEMNASSERPGRRVLADLQEATQSGHVEGTKVSSGGISSFFKPTLSTNVSTTPTTNSKIKTKRKASTAKRKTKEGPLTKFFSPSSSKVSAEEQTTEIAVSTNDESKSSIKNFFKAERRSDSQEERSSSPVIQTDSTKASSSIDDKKIKCSNATIILFDDVDVVFDDEGDEGFWMALETVLKSSKKPCVLTATRGYESVLKRCRILQNSPVVELHRPSPTQVAELVKRICVDEDRDLTDYNVEFMCQYLASDVRRSLLQMEFETVSPGLLQTVYPANKTLGGLMTSGYLSDVLDIQRSYRRVGFNALYASLEDCLPFEFDSITAVKETSSNEERERRATKFERQTLNDLSRIFDEFSVSDLFAGCLDRMGEEYLPSYERAKRWMEHRPMEPYDCNPRSVEELVEISGSVLLGEAGRSLNCISERFAALEAAEKDDFRLPRVINHLGFHEIHKQLKKVRISDKTLDDVLDNFAVKKRVAFEYLNFLNQICRTEEQRRSSDLDMPRRRNRFMHYLPQIGIFISPDQIIRFSNFWN